MPVRAASTRSAICSCAPAPKRSSNIAIPAGRNSHDSVTSVPPSVAVKAYPHRIKLPPTTNANSRPRSAATTSERVSQVRSGNSLRPVNQAPTRGLSPSSHQHALQTGLHSPMRVTSEIMSYRSSGDRAMTTESLCVSGSIGRV